jgi:UDP-glucose 4-epimerase
VTASYPDFYRGRSVLVTGGLGFIGSNLARQLVQLGARVVLVDSMFPDYGGNTFNIDGIEDRVRVVIGDVRDEAANEVLVRDHDVIFNLAGQVSHIDSMRDPFTDLDINCRAQLSILEACRKYNPEVRIVFAGTRQVYGRPERLPVDETHLVRPADINGVNKAAGEYYHLLYSQVFGMNACSLRLTNVYGPRQLIKHNRQGFIGWFVRLAIEGREIQVYGDGSQLRDFVYVDDAADAFLRAAICDDCQGEVLNVGGDRPISHRDLVRVLVDIAGSGSVRFVDWPDDKKRIDIGSFYSDSTRFRTLSGWQPRVTLEEGLARTVGFYRQHFAHYTQDLPLRSQQGVK